MRSSISRMNVPPSWRRCFHGNVNAGNKVSIVKYFYGVSVWVSTIKPAPSFRFMVRCGAVQINQNQVRQLSDIRYILADCSPLDAEIWIWYCFASFRWGKYTAANKATLCNFVSRFLPQETYYVQGPSRGVKMLCIVYEKPLWLTFLKFVYGIYPEN